MSKQVFLNEETGEILDHLGNPMGNILSDKISDNSMILRGLSKVFDMFELDDDKIFAFVKRNTVDRFMSRRIENDVHDDMDLGSNYDPRVLSDISVNQFVTQKEREAKMKLDEVSRKNIELTQKMIEQEKKLDEIIKSKESQTKKTATKKTNNKKDEDQ